MHQVSWRITGGLVIDPMHAQNKTHIVWLGHHTSVDQIFQIIHVAIVIDFHFRLDSLLYKVFCGFLRPEPVPEHVIDFPVPYNITGRHLELAISGGGVVVVVRMPSSISPSVFPSNMGFAGAILC